MLKRTLTTLAMAAVGLPAIILGGPFYYLVFTIFLVGAAWEFAHLYRAVKYEPHALFTALSVLVIATARFFFADWSVPLLVLSVMLAMTVHLFAFERRRDQAAVDFAITVAGIVYLGWVGSYLLYLRQVGVPLPLVSYGGTALVTLFLGMGILMSIHRHRMLVQK